MQSPADVMEEHFRALARDGLRALGFERAYAGDLGAWQSGLRADLARRIRLDDVASHEVTGEVVGEDRQDGFRRRLVRIRARDGAIVPAYWLVPDGLAGPAPTLLALHGHGPGKAVAAGASQDAQRNDLVPAGERDFGARAARRGYPTLVPDLRGFGEMSLPETIAAGRPSACVEMSMRAIAAGRSLVGMRVRDLMSCVDWLARQPEVDGARIVATGQSGGATYTTWAAAMDERIAAAAPCCGFASFERSILSIHHCPCNYVPGLADVCEAHDLAGLVAPRPLLVVAGALDPIFPLEGVREAFDRLRPIYEAAGAADRLGLRIGPEGHRYYAEPLWGLLDRVASAPPERA